MRRLAKLFALIAIAATLCGFNSGNFAHDLSAYRGELVRDAVARLRLTAGESTTGGLPPISAPIGAAGLSSAKFGQPRSTASSSTGATRIAPIRAQSDIPLWFIRLVTRD